MKLTPVGQSIINKRRITYQLETAANGGVREGKRILVWVGGTKAHLRRKARFDGEDLTIDLRPSSPYTTYFTGPENTKHDVHEIIVTKWHNDFDVQSFERVRIFVYQTKTK